MYRQIKDIKIQTCVETIKKMSKWAGNLGTAWYPVKTDLEVNAKRIDVYQNPPYSWKHMGSGFKKEYSVLGNDCYVTEGSLILATIWALRAMRTLETFCSNMMEQMAINTDAPMGDSVSSAYNNSLKNYQSTFMQIISSGVILAANIDKTPAWKRMKCNSHTEAYLLLNDILKESQEVTISISAFLKNTGIDENFV